MQFHCMILTVLDASVFFDCLCKCCSSTAGGVACFPGFRFLAEATIDVAGAVHVLVAIGSPELVAVQM